MTSKSRLYIAAAFGAFAALLIGFAAQNAVAQVERWCPPNVPMCGGEGDPVQTPPDPRNGGVNGGYNGGFDGGGNEG